MPPIPDRNNPHAANSSVSFAKLFQAFGVVLPAVNGTKDICAEECPFCAGDRFYLNVESGTYVCHNASRCGQRGNAYTFIRRVHQTSLDATSDEDYHKLRDKRELPLQTLKRHKLAWNEHTGNWLIPYMSQQGEALNLTRYDLASGGKYTLPCLPQQLYGLDTLTSDASLPLFVCEGPFDAIALDQHMREKKSRQRYDILAVPSASVFKPPWLNHLVGRTVRLCFDNDKAGRDGQQRIIKLARDAKTDCKLHALQWPTGTPDKYDIGDLVRNGDNVVEFTREHCLKEESGKRILLVRGDEIPEEKQEWLWTRRIPLVTFASLSGPQGSSKSALCKHLAGRVTAGLPMPLCEDEDRAAPAGVLYFTSEDSQAQVRDLVRIAGGDLSRLWVHDIISGDEPIDILDCLEEMEALIKQRQVRLVVLDALNSFVGGDISSDAKARRSLSGRLMSLARRTQTCVIGIRNASRMEGGTASQRALGAVSLSHVSRCDMNTMALPHSPGEPWRFVLEFEKVSGTAPPEPVGFVAEDLSTGKEDAHLRRLCGWMGGEQIASLCESVNEKGSRKK